MALMLEQISASQRMKANHNIARPIIYLNRVGTNISKSKNESKSQRLMLLHAIKRVGTNISKSKNESKSQPLATAAAPINVGTNISKSKNESKSQRCNKPAEKSSGWNKYQQVKE